MNTLPLWAQIAIPLLSVTNISTVIISVFVYRQKDQELKDAKLQRLNDNLVQNTRPHIDPLYIPINKILAKLESGYDEYKAVKGRCHGYEVEKSRKAEDESESELSLELGRILYAEKYSALLAFSGVAKELLEYQEKMIKEGTSAYLTAEFDEQLDSFIRFLYGVRIIIHTYLLCFKDVPEGQPKGYVLGTLEFEKEFYSEIDYISHTSVNLPSEHQIL